MFSNSLKLPTRNELHIARKIWHMGMGSLGLWAYNASFTEAFGQKFWAFTAIFIAISGILFDFFRLRIPSLHIFSLKVGGVFYRENEMNSFSGLPFYALGVGLSLLLFDEKIAILSISFLIFADPISSFVGIMYGRNKIMRGKKSIEGAFAGFMTCYCLTFVTCMIYNVDSFSLFFFCFIAGLIGCLSELLSTKIDDNLTIPVISGAGLTLLNEVFKLI